MFFTVTKFTVREFFVPLQVVPRAGSTRAKRFKVKGKPPTEQIEETPREIIIEENKPVQEEKAQMLTEPERTDLRAIGPSAKADYERKIYMDTEEVSQALLKEFGVSTLFGTSGRCVLPPNVQLQPG